MLGLTLHQMLNMSRLFDEAYVQHRAAFEASGYTNARSGALAQANRRSYIDHQARVFIATMDLSYDECVFDPQTREITGFSDPVLGELFWMVR